MQFVILPAYSGSSYMPSIIMERPLYIRERSDGLYIPLVYFLFKMTEELLIATVISPIFAAMIFYGVRLHGSFALVWVAYLLTCCCGISLAYGAFPFFQ